MHMAVSRQLGMPAALLHDSHSSTLIRRPPVIITVFFPRTRYEKYRIIVTPVQTPEFIEIGLKPTTPSG